MSGSQVASNSGSALALASTPVQILKLVKPAAGRTENFYGSFDGSVKFDFTAIANEQVTFFHDSKNQSLHVIFTDGSQVIIEPFFDSMGVLSALTEGPAQSGAEFNDPSIDSLPPNIKLALLPPEELPSLVFHETIPVLPPLGGAEVVEAEEVVPPNPSLNITKDASVSGGTADVAGEVISYTITVANTGNQTLTGVTVTDPYADAGSVVRGPDVVGNN